MEKLWNERILNNSQLKLTNSKKWLPEFILIRVGVPHIILAEEEEAGPGRAPAAIIEDLCPGVYGQQGALHHVIRPDPGRPGQYSTVEYMGAEPQNSFKGEPRGPLCGKLTTRHHR